MMTGAGLERDRSDEIKGNHPRKNRKKVADKDICVQFKSGNFFRILKQTLFCS